MTYRPLNSLPPETLVNIASYLDPSPLPDLTSFALTSKACYDAAAIHLFRSISIQLMDPQKLQDDVNRWLERLEWTNLTRHVRHLTVSFDARVEAIFNDWPRGNRLTGAGFNWDVTGLVSMDQRRHARWAFENPAAWDPLIKLLVALGGLSRLVIDHEPSLSPQLAEALRQHHPRCRLDLRRISMSSLHGQKTSRESKDLALFASPRLDSITFDDYTPKSPKGPLPIDECIKFELAAYELVAGLAPNLKSVGFNQFPTREMKDPWDDVPRSFIPQGLISLVPRWSIHGEASHRGSAADTPHPGSPTSLSIDSPSRSRLKAWSNVVDFSTLRQLKLYVCELEVAWLAQNVKLHCLSDLGLGLSLVRQETLEAFLGTLPPLESLSLTGTIGPETFRLVVDKAGGSLRRLSVVPSLDYVEHVFDPRQVDLLPQACPLLEEVLLTTSYLAFASVSTIICENLGRIGRLRTVSLALAADPQYVKSTCGKESVRAAWDAIRGQGCRLETMLVNVRRKRAGVPIEGYQVRRLGSGDDEKILVQSLP